MHSVRQIGTLLVKTGEDYWGQPAKADMQVILFLGLIFSKFIQQRRIEPRTRVFKEVWPPQEGAGSAWWPAGTPQPRDSSGCGLRLRLSPQTNVFSNMQAESPQPIPGEHTSPGSISTRDKGQEDTPG